MKTVLTIGVFDLLHTGHLNLFKRAAELGDLIVAIPTSDGAKRAKGKEVVMSFEERFRVVNALECVYMTIGFEDNDGAEKIVELIKPDIICRADDWEDFPGSKTAKRLGIKIIYLPYTIGISTTAIKDKICLTQCSKQKKS